MPTIAILPEYGEDQQTTFSAVTSGHKATGRTVGEALDALTSQLSAEELGGPVIVQQFHPDQYFSASQRDRLSTLMARWQSARDAGEALTAAEQSELEKLVEEETAGAGRRSAFILSNLEMTQLRRRAEKMRYRSMMRLPWELPGKRARRLYILGLVELILGLLLIILPIVYYYSRGLPISLLVGVAVMAAILQIVYLLLHRREDALRKRAESFFPEAEEVRRGNRLPFSDSVESLAEHGKDR